MRPAASIAAAAVPAAAMRLILSSHPRLEPDGGPARPLAGPDAALLAWLAIEGPTPRARLAQLLWPDKEEAVARNALRQRLFRLRASAGIDLVVGTTLLALADTVAHDLAGADDVLAGAVDPVLADGELAAWLGEQRMRRRAARRQALASLAQQAEQAGQWSDALAHARALLGLEPLSEEAHRRVMRVHYLSGDRAAALLAFDACERTLKDEVGTRPSAETLALLAAVEASLAPPVTPTREVPASILRPPRLIGREQDLTALAQAWQAGHVVALIGEAGLGKTRLLQEFAHGRAGVVMAAGRPGDAGVPFATLARLLRALVGDARDTRLALPGPARSEIARVLPEFDAAVPARLTPESQRLVLVRALRALLAAHGSVTTLVLDDLHFADAASVEMLGHLIDDDDDAPGPAQRWMLALRPIEVGTPARALQDGLAEQARLAVHTLQPLDVPALASLVASLGLPDIDADALAPGLFHRTGGNPLFVLETLKQAWVEQTLAQLADARRLPRPLSVEHLIRRRLGQLSTQARNAARVCAIAGVDFTLPLAEHVLRLPAIALSDAIGELEAAQVMRGDAFAHDLVADAVRASVPDTVARHTHAQVAEWLEARGGEPARVAQHWIDAGLGPRARPWLQQAARIAGGAARHREALAFLKMKSAIEEAMGERDAAFASLLAATQVDVGVHCGLDAGLEICDQLDRLATGAEQQARAALARSGLLAIFRSAERALEHGLRALRLAESIEHEALAMSAHGMLADAYALVDQFARAAHHARACLDWVESHGDASTRAGAHERLATQLDNLGRGAEAVSHHERALAIAVDANDLLVASITCVNLCRNRIFAGQIEAAADACSRAEQYAAAYEDASAHLPMIQLFGALVDSTVGRYGLALERVERALRFARQHVPGNTVAQALVRWATCWWHLGQWARMKQALDAVDADALGTGSIRVAHARMAWAYAAATQGGEAARLEQALRRAVESLREGERPDVRLPAALALVDPRAGSGALDAIEAIRAEAQQIGHANVLLATHLREAEIAVATDPRRARRAALAALALRAQGVHTTALLPAEFWLHASRALDAAGDRAHAAEVASQGREWVGTAASHVPETFRDGFLSRNRVNRLLLEQAARFDAR